MQECVVIAVDTAKRVLDPRTSLVYSFVKGADPRNGLVYSVVKGADPEYLKTV